jgi:hypothetical protein
LSPAFVDAVEAALHQVDELGVLDHARAGDPGVLLGHLSAFVAVCQAFDQQLVADQEGRADGDQDGRYGGGSQDPLVLREESDAHTQAEDSE